ncbi:MAG: sulfurtransferase TusA family protein [Gemmataceae bacterium]|nr:sulfurtransferase TusA family protein [Gemmataceae bacterium]
MKSEPTTVHSLMFQLERWEGAKCFACRRPLCGHAVLCSVALGLKDTPRCPECLARGLRRPLGELLVQLLNYVQRRECYQAAWAAACDREGLPRSDRPSCMPPVVAESEITTEPGDAPTTPDSFDADPFDAASADARSFDVASFHVTSFDAQSFDAQSFDARSLDAQSFDAQSFDAEWDAGSLGCGDLVLELRQRLRALPPGRILRLIAQDPGAAADLPSWCRLTGHRLIHAEPPIFLIRRKEDA